MGPVDAMLLAILTVTIGLVGFGGLGLLYLLLTELRRRNGDAAASGPPPQALTDAMILFQSMRDVLEQQKKLAHQLNDAVNRKVAAVREAVQVYHAELDKMRALEAELARKLERTRDAVEAIEQRIEAQGSTGIPSAPAAEPEPATPEERADAPRLRLHVLEKPAPPPRDEVLDNWVGFDFGGEFPEPEPEPPPPEPVEEAEERETRSAVRSLLDLDGAGPAAAEPGGMPARGARSNGHNGQTPLQARVYAYADAGMSVHQIASELGMGKGEVRLILNLRQNQTG